MIGARIKKIRKSLGDSQFEFANKLCASQGQIWSIESGKQFPSKMLIELLIYKFNIDRAWLIDGVSSEIEIGKSKAEKLEPSFSSKVMVSAAVAATAFPQVSVALIAGVGAGKLLKRICKAYGVNNKAELANDCFGISKSTISSWLKKDTIPEKYLNKTVMETGVTADFLLDDDQIFQANYGDVIELVDCLGKNIKRWKLLEDTLKEEQLRKFFLGAEEGDDQRISALECYLTQSRQI